MIYFSVSSVFFLKNPNILSSIIKMVIIFVPKPVSSDYINADNVAETYHLSNSLTIIKLA